ncbi:MAG: hypothetical protein FRX49_05153 [Trebouxia sp. A1-2]|nr:MAG: hypothetical protein FRX49_05153 [Trebouxia sp. A1-2]
MPLWPVRLHTRPPLVSLPCCTTDRGKRSLRGRDTVRHRGILHVVASASKQDLSSLCHSIQQGYYELCVENAGRPAAAALTQIVRSAACAFKAGHSMDRLRLEVEHGGYNEVHLKSGSCCLTETDKQYRRQFLDTVYITMQMLFLHDEGFDKSVAAALTWQREWTDADWSILSLVDTVLTGQANGEEQMAVQLDRALATSGKAILDLMYIVSMYVWFDL